MDQIQELCPLWLQPETRTKEQMIIEQLVMERFLNSLPQHVHEWVRSKLPKNSKENGILMVDLIKACGIKGERKETMAVLLTDNFLYF